MVYIFLKLPFIQEYFSTNSEWFQFIYHFYCNSMVASFVMNLNSNSIDQIKGFNLDLIWPISLSSTFFHFIRWFFVSHYILNHSSKDFLKNTLSHHFHLNLKVDVRTMKDTSRLRLTLNTLKVNHFFFWRI